MYDTLTFSFIFCGHETGGGFGMEGKTLFDTVSPHIMFHNKLELSIGCIQHYSGNRCTSLESSPIEYLLL